MNIKTESGWSKERRKQQSNRMLEKWKQLHWREHMVAVHSVPAEVLFWSKVIKKRGCWGWKGSFTDKGYAIIAKQHEKKLAHRLSWELHNKEEIPKGMNVLHSCDNPPCTNPRHLNVGTQSQNIQQMYDRGRGYWQNRLSDLNTRIKENY